MSKIICDVCGSSYSENATQCPICGTAKSDSAKPAAEPVVEEQAPKGGRFSRNNVSRPASGGRKPSENKDGKDEPSSNLPMIIIVTVLLLAIVAVCVFIAVRFMDKPDDPAGSSSSSDIANTDPSGPAVVDVPCTGIELVNNDTNTLSFSAANETARLTMKALPENTTEDVTYTFTSSNPAVVLVDPTGVVTPVASGSATITVSYGSYSVTVDVTVDLPVVITELKLKYSDVTLSPSNGLVLNLYDGEVDAADITWTSADETVATVENGVVTAVGNNKKGVVITATYGDLKATCLVRVTGITERDYYLSTGYQTGTDISVTLVMGSDESFTLKLIDKKTNEPVKDVTWTFSPEGGSFCTKTVLEDGVKVTATKATTSATGGFVYIQAEYNGEVYRCRIYTQPAASQN